MKFSNSGVVYGNEEREESERIIGEKIVRASFGAFFVICERGDWRYGIGVVIPTF